MDAYQKLVAMISASAIDFSKKEIVYQKILDDIGDSKLVLIGEASHGTKEFYQTRAEISKLLIEQKGFHAIAVEADWPDTYPIYRYLQGMGNKNRPELALTAFERFPTWMWRNEIMPPFLMWLRNFNDSLKEENKIGFYGLDLYSFYGSMRAVIEYLNKVDENAAKRAKERYACFDHSQHDAQNYGYLASLGLKKACIKEVIEQLQDMQHHAFSYLKNDGLAANDEYFFATQNARLVKNAEKYYRSMFEGHVESWNIRDSHMHETLLVIADHLQKKFNQTAKIIVWAHNSHIGDARATEMGEKQEINLGQLVRESHAESSYLLGFSTFTGTVTAANDWGEPAECKKVNPGFHGSYEELFHEVNYKNFFLPLSVDISLETYLNLPRLQRAIGVIYRPQTERYSHYFFSRLPRQFDGIIHLDKTQALEPLDKNPEWQNSEVVHAI